MRSLVFSLALAYCAATRTVAQEHPPLFSKRDASWSAAALAASIALSTADTRVAAHWNDSTNRSVRRDGLARGFAKIQDGSLTVGNLALYGIFRLTEPERSPTSGPTTNSTDSCSGLRWFDTREPSENQISFAEQS